MNLTGSMQVSPLFGLSKMQHKGHIKDSLQKDLKPIKTTGTNATTGVTVYNDKERKRTSMYLLCKPVHW